MSHHHRDGAPSLHGLGRRCCAGVVSALCATLKQTSALAAGLERRGTLRLLALPYADHPDYRAEWKP